MRYTSSRSQTTRQIPKIACVKEKEQTKLSSILNVKNIISDWNYPSKLLHFAYEYIIYLFRVLLFPSSKESQNGV